VEPFLVGNLQWKLFAEGVFVDASVFPKGSVDVLGANRNIVGSVSTPKRPIRNSMILSNAFGHVWPVILSAAHPNQQIILMSFLHLSLGKTSYKNKFSRIVSPTGLRL